ncbi:hypothetical protein ACOMHN_020691 [Nucella lapillus]
MQSSAVPQRMDAFQPTPHRVDACLLPSPASQRLDACLPSLLAPPGVDACLPSSLAPPRDDACLPSSLAPPGDDACLPSSPAPPGVDACLPSSLAPSGGDACLPPSLAPPGVDACLPSFSTRPRVDTCVVNGKVPRLPYWTRGKMNKRSRGVRGGCSRRLSPTSKAEECTNLSVLYFNAWSCCNKTLEINDLLLMVALISSSYLRHGFDPPDMNLKLLR